MKKIKPLKRRLLFLFFLFVIFSHSLFYIYQNQQKFFSRNYETRFESLKQMYDHSQYVQKKNPGIITDETFEAFAGGIFLKGLNPILIVHDHPPLGRYLVSLSILLFDNEHILILLCLFFSYFGIFLIAKHILPNEFIALIPLAITVNEPLFFNKLVYTPLPEPILLPFIIFSLYFFIRGIQTSRYVSWFVATSVCLGCVISIRFFILGFVLLSVMILYLLIHKNIRRTILFFATLPLMIVILEASYLRTIQSGYNLVKVLSIQKYILAYHQSKFIVPFTYWDLLFFNRWHTWWGNRAILSDPQWIIFWPVSMGITLISGLLGILRKNKLTPAEQVIIGWVILYSLMLSVGYSSTRYFLPLLPFLYIISTSWVYKFVLRFRGKK